MIPKFIHTFNRPTLIAIVAGAFLWNSNALAELSIDGSVSPSNLPNYLNDNGAIQLTFVNINSGTNVSLDGGDSITHSDSLTLYGYGTTLGRLTLSGSGTTWSCSDLILGTSQIDILNGASLGSDSSFDESTAAPDRIGHNSGSRALVRISGLDSIYYTANNIYLPDAGPGNNPQPVGEIMIEDGGRMFWASRVSIAYNFHIGSSRAGAAGTLTVTGAGSNLSLGGTRPLMEVRENGKLVVKNGASVTDGSPSLEDPSRITIAGGQVEILSTAMVEVDDLHINYLGGDLQVSGAGTQLKVKSSGLINRGHISAGNGSSVICQGSLENYGTVEIMVNGNNSIQLGVVPDDYAQFENTSSGVVTFKASPGLAAGNYNPVTFTSTYASATFTGTGTYKAIGGTWDTATETFTVSEPEIMTTGVTNQSVSSRRFFFRRPSFRRWGWGSFSSRTLPSGIFQLANFSSPTMEDALNVAFSNDAGVASFSSSEVTTLSPINGCQMLVAFDIVSDLSGSETAVSFDIGTGFPVDDLAIFQSSNGGTSWSEIDSFSYEDGWISITTSTFGQFAVTINSPIGNASKASLEVINSSNVELTIPTQNEKLYSIWSTDSLNSPWACIEQLTGDGTSQKIIDPTALKSAQFYQIREN